MKIICFTRSESTRASPKGSVKNINKVQKIVKFEDCAKANQEFKSQAMEKLNTKNQYLSALTGW